MSNPHPKLSNLKHFPKGVSGNPGGKPVGTRNRLNTRFLNALTADFEAHGEEAIEAVRERDPVAYVKLVASLLPQEFAVVAERPVEMLSDAELWKIILAGRKESAVEGEVIEAE